MLHRADLHLTHAEMARCHEDASEAGKRRSGEHASQQSCLPELEAAAGFDCSLKCHRYLFVKAWKVTDLLLTG